MQHYTKKDILKLVEEEDVEFIRLQFTDVFGTLKNIAITSSQLEKALENSFEDYGRISIRSSKVTPCCSVPYFHISFHINVDEII